MPHDLEGPPASAEAQPTTNSPTFADAWAAWLTYRRAGPRPLRLSTLADYESAHRRYLGPFFGDTALDAIDGALIARFVVWASGHGISAKRLSNLLVPLRACLRWHHRMGMFSRDPTPWFDTATPPPRERLVLDIEQVEHLVSATPAHFQAFVATAAYTGMRLGELRALTWDDIDLDARTARVDKTRYRGRLETSPKTGQGRVVPLPRHLAAMLADWRDRCPASAEDLLFPLPAGTPSDADDFRARVFKPAGARAGLPEGLRFHDLRHTSASLYLQHGATVREVMAIHGWRQMQTALRYLHNLDSLNEAADRLSAARDVLR